LAADFAGRFVYKKIKKILYCVPRMLTDIGMRPESLRIGVFPRGK